MKVPIVPLHTFTALLLGTVNGKERGQRSTSGNKRRREEADTEDAGMSLLSVHACVSDASRPVCIAGRTSVQVISMYLQHTMDVLSRIPSVSTSLHTLDRLSLQLTCKCS